MVIERYSVNQYKIQTLLTWIETEAIAIPEIQRPFVWDSSKVRDFIDSLYRGYPVGYLIGWRNPSVRLKDGSESANKMILIDGQQRMMALMAALLGKEIISKNYTKAKITIAFNPSEEKFEVTNPAIRKDRAWFPEISKLFESKLSLWRLVNDYCEKNQGRDPDIIFERLSKLESIKNNVLGFIDLNSDLDVETVSDIFVRINSKGVSLNAADFAMSKMAANEKLDGHQLRKCIDYFCHLAIQPESYDQLRLDKSFADTEYFKEMKWLKKEKDDLYDPTYTDMLRVASVSEFHRGKMSDLVALLSGRNFETRKYEENIAEDAFARLSRAILRFMNETNFKRFLMILRSAGFVKSSMIGAKNQVNFAYIVFLTLRAQKEDHSVITSLVSRWYVMSVLTGRYRGASETTFGEDIRNINEEGVTAYLNALEQAELSDAFWNIGLPQQMKTSRRNSPHFNVFLASQVVGSDKGFLSASHTVSNLLLGALHIHHIFPVNFLKKHGVTQRSYNQIANYVVIESATNIAIKDTPPSQYFSEHWQQCENDESGIGGISDCESLKSNLHAHCIPEGIEDYGVDDYEQFLTERRLLMAKKIRNYYKSL